MACECGAPVFNKKHGECKRCYDRNRKARYRAGYRYQKKVQEPKPKKESVASKPKVTKAEPPAFDVTPYADLLAEAEAAFAADIWYAVEIAEDAAILRVGGDPGKWPRAERCTMPLCDNKGFRAGRCEKHRVPMRERAEPTQIKKYDTTPIWLSSIPRITITPKESS